MSHAKRIGDISQAQGFCFLLPVAGLGISGNPRDFGGGVAGGVVSAASLFFLTVWAFYVLDSGGGMQTAINQPTTERAYHAVRPNNN